MDEIPSNANYVEIHILNKTSKHDDGFIFDISLEKDVFFDLLKKMKKFNFKFFQKNFKEYVHKDVTCQCFVSDDFKVNRNKILHLNIQPSYVCIGYNRHKLSLLNFPSTKNVQQKRYVKRLIFRVSNRLYINFEVSLDSSVSNEKQYSVFINYNHDPNVDISIVTKSFNEIMNELTPKGSIS